MNEDLASRTYLAMAAMGCALVTHGGLTLVNALGLADLRLSAAAGVLFLSTGTCIIALMVKR